MEELTPAEAFFKDSTIIFNVYRLSSKENQKERILNIIKSCYYEDLRPLLLYFYELLREHTDDEIRKMDDREAFILFSKLEDKTTAEQKTAYERYNKETERLNGIFSDKTEEVN